MPGFGPSLPLSTGKTDIGFALTKTYKEQIQQNIKILVLTAPGEKVFDANFGVGIRKYLFENYSWQTEQKIKTDISNQIERYLPNVIIDEIKVSFEEEKNKLFLSIQYFVSDPPLQDLLSLEFIRE
jgi:phage baseplate assembly protein W